jgi:hypothetical protein
VAGAKFSLLQENVCQSAYSSSFLHLSASIRESQKSESYYKCRNTSSGDQKIAKTFENRTNKPCRDLVCNQLKVVGGDTSPSEVGMGG